jgi:hypothetical protein
LEHKEVFHIFAAIITNYQIQYDNEKTFLDDCANGVDGNQR